MTRDPKVLRRDVVDAVRMIRFLGRVPTPGRVIRMVRSMHTEVHAARHEQQAPPAVPLWVAVGDDPAGALRLETSEGPAALVVDPSPQQTAVG